MKKAVVCVLLALVLVVALEPHTREAMVARVMEWMPGQEDAATQEGQMLTFSQQMGASARTDMLDVTLYFRFADTDVLGAQHAQLDIRREETIATSIVQRLIDGPDIAHERLSGVFPQGTRLISVTGEGTTAFVTLSREFLGRPDGAPADWEDLSDWQAEAALRRRLAVQSIALALTEDGRFQRVQLYVADSDNEIPQRVELFWMDAAQTDRTLLLAACPRDEQAMLTPQRAMGMILGAWQKQDWAALYPLMAGTLDEPLPTLSAFEGQMADIGVSLLDYEVSAGSASLDGRRATLVLDANVRAREGGDALLARESVPLERVQDNWAMTLETLRSLMIRD